MFTESSAVQTSCPMTVAEDEAAGVGDGVRAGEGVADGGMSADAAGSVTSGAVVAMGSGVGRGVEDAVAEGAVETGGVDAEVFVSEQPASNNIRSRANASKRPPARVLL
jgi:hypothetical protein